MIYTTPDKLTAAMLTRVTLGGTVSRPHELPQTTTHYKQVGALFYPQLAAVFTRVSERYAKPECTGDWMAGYIAIQCVGRKHGANALHDMARLELALGDMQAGPLAQAQAAIVAYMCGAVGAPVDTPYGGDPATFDMCEPWARRMLALTASHTL